MFPTNLFSKRPDRRAFSQGNQLSHSHYPVSNYGTMCFSGWVLRWTLIVKAAAAPHSMRSYGSCLFKEVGELSQIVL
jgi:hypothetical protein